MSLSNITASEFEDLRIALMNNYNTEALTHAGYIVALIIGVCALFASDAFIGLYTSRNKVRLGVFYVILSSSLSLIGYFAIRLLFWSWLGSEVLIITPNIANATQMPTWISAIHYSTMQRFVELNDLGFIATTDGLTIGGILLILIISFIISLLCLTIVGELFIQKLGKIKAINKNGVSNKKS